MAPDKYAVFIEPSDTLRDLLLDAKARVDVWRPAQVYCDHPPHCTLIVGSYHSPEAWLPALRHRLSKFPPTELWISKWLVFPNDIAAGGGQTVTMAVAPCPELFQLQTAVAEVLGPYQLFSPHPWTMEPYVTSQHRYGFPFVGEHWQPHFTVASLSTGLDDPFISQMTSIPLDIIMTAKEVGVWRVTSGTHIHIETVPLGKSA